MDPLLPLTGFLVGLLIGLTGMGGGALMTPFLILVLGTRPTIAVGTDLVYSSVTKIFGALIHWRQHTVDMALVRRLALGSVPGGLSAVLLLRLLPDSRNSDALVKSMLGVVLILVAVIVVVRTLELLPTPFPERWRHKLEGRGTIIAGAIVGTLVGFTSVGSGSLLVPFLVFVYPLSSAVIVGTDVMHAAILVTVTALGHAQAGSVNWTLAMYLLIGSIPGVAIGSRLAPRVPARALRLGIATVLFMTGVSLV